MRFILTLALGVCALASPARADVFSFLDTGHITQTGPRELYVTPDDDGLYYIFADVNGARVRFVIDTGSDDVVLTRKDAQRAGIDVANLKFSEDYDAASGSGVEADAMVQRITLGPLSFSNLAVTVEEEGGASLLGMSFLHRMKSVEIRDNRLYLRW
ncbi:MAG TPA: TIGR02281 family clan AA aspartic protease [Rhizomicrobium sp.]|jgi:aspartyl protease family protein